MAPIDLNLVRAFVAVHEGGSFSAAGQRLGVPRSTVSRAVAALEHSIDVLLFHRTTRRVTTTAAGRALHERLSPPLLALEGSLSDLPERKDEHADAVYLVYPSRRHLPHRGTAFRELVLEMLRHRPLPTL